MIAVLRPKLFHIILTVSFLWCFGLVYWATKEEVGVSPDSVTYILAAKSLLSGRGFFINGVPLTHFPPLYPALIGLSGWFFNGDVLRGARFFQAVLYGLNIALIGVTIYLNTRSNLIAALCAMMLALSSKHILQVHTWAWSEPMFFGLVTLCLISLTMYHRDNSLRPLIFASLFLGFSALTRYVGIMLVPAVALYIIVMTKASLFKRLQNALLTFSITGALIGGWIVRNLLLAGNATNRQIAIHFVRYKDFRQMIYTLMDFLSPWRISGWIFLGILGFGVCMYWIGILFLRRKHSEEIASASIFLPVIAGLYVIFYCGFLLLSKSFLDAATPFDYRILSPVYLWMIMGSVSLLFSFLTFGKRARWKWTIVVIFLIVTIINGWRTLSFVETLRQNGEGYTSRQWDMSSTLMAIDGIPDTITIYSNGYDVILFRTGREAFSVPAHTNSLSLQTNSSFQLELSNICEEVKQGVAVIVYFTAINRWYLPSEKEIRRYCSGIKAQVLSDGVVFTHINHLKSISQP